MITQEDIQSFVSTQPAKTQEVFYKLITNPDRFVKQGLVKVAKSTVDTYIKSTGVELGESWQKTLSSLFSVEDLFFLVQQEVSKVQKPGKVKRFFFNLLVNYTLRIDLNSMSYAEQLLSGDAIFLASLYLSLQN